MQPTTRKEMLLDEKWISTPDMGEYLDSSLISKAAEELSKGELGGEFFIEKPFSTVPGYYPTENVVLLSGKASFQSDEYEIGNTGMNRTDGDTVYLNFEELIDGGSEVVFNTTDKPMTPVAFLKHATTTIENAEMLGVRILGIDCPELPHFRTFKYNQTLKPVFVTYGDLIAAKDGRDMVKTTSGKYIRKSAFAYVKYQPMSYPPVKRDPKELLAFIGEVAKDVNDDTGEKEMQYMEIVEAPKVNNDGTPQFKPEGVIRLCLVHGEPDDSDMEIFKQALDVQRDMLNLVRNATNVIYMLDQSYLANKGKGLVPYDYRKEYEKISSSPIYAFKSLYKNITQAGESAYQQLGKRYFGQELNGRYLGACYVEQDTPYGKQWINVAKYLLSKYPKVSTLPSYSNSGATDSEFSNVSDAFKLWTYDQTKQAYLDKMNDMGDDDRSDIQKQITGVELSELTNHTVMIGDCLLMIPPTSIRTVTQTRSERTSLIRSKGSVTKTLPKTERIIEMQLFFNGADAINGTKFEQQTPSGTTMTYHMNGLRSLVSQFKFTPFLPIHNDYINYVLNIEAVSLVSIQIQTVPNYPKTLQATIKLQEFDYRQYMPEILPPDAEKKEDLYTNLFSKVIHWPVFRYYYQRAINSGEELSDMLFDSEPYRDATVGQKTSLQNMKFMTPTFELFVANEEMLKQRKSIKQSLERNPIESIITFNSKEKEMLKDIAKTYESIRKAMSTCEKEIKELMNPKSSSEFVYYLRDKNTSITRYYSEVDSGGVLDSNNGIGKNGPDFGIYHDAKSGSSTPIDKLKKKVYDMYNKTLKDLIIKMMPSIKNLNVAYFSNADFVFVQKVDESRTDYSIGIELNINWNGLGYKETLDKVRRVVAKSNNILVGDIFKEGKAFIGWSSVFEQDAKFLNQNDHVNVESLRVDKESPDYLAMSYLASAFGLSMSEDKEPEDDMWSGSEDIGDMKDNIDLETSKSIKYDFYDIGNPIINNISFAYNNIFNNMSMKIYDGYASQFTGGSDTSIEIDMTATNEFTVSQMQCISRICSQRMIDFRKILASSPLRINSEMTRFMGVNEVIIESVDISTVPNYPGTWNINMRLMSVDRTLRNREAMKKLDKITNVETNMDSIVKTKNYFDVKNTLAKVELYPDLELPTISELEKLGFYFIKYKAESARTFPDADFYFSYLHVFSSDMLRETIVNFFKESDNKALYQEYAGNLFENDKALVKWNLSKDNSSIKQDEIDAVSGSDYSSTNSKRLSDLNEAVMTPEYLREYNKEMNKLNTINNINQKDSEKEKGETLKLVEKANRVKESVFGLREALDCSNFDSYDFNSVNKVSVKGQIPYSQEKAYLAGKKDMRVYEGNNVFKKTSSEDRVYDSIESLKKIIIEILSKPILKGSLVPSANTEYTKLFEYLGMDILGATAMNGLSYKTDSLMGTLFKWDNSLSTLLDACSRGATANLGVFDIDKFMNGEKKEKETMSQSIIKASMQELDQKATDEANGEKVYKSVKKDLPNILFPVDGQGVSSFALATTKEEQEKGLVFGNFAIKKYSPTMLSNIFEVDFIDAKDGFLDPYYNAKLAKLLLDQDITAEEELKRQNEYIAGLAMYDKSKKSQPYSDNAFFRTMLVWLYRLISDKRQSLLPDSFFLMSEMNELLEGAAEVDDNMWQNMGQWFKKTGLGFSTGSLNKKSKDESAFTSKQQEKLDEQNKQLDALKEETVAEKEIEQLQKDIKKDLPRLRLALFNGLFLSLGAISLTEFSTPVYTAIKSGDLATYSTYIEKIKGSNVSAQTVSDTDMQIRRMFQFLDYQFDNSSDYDMISVPYVTDKYSFQGKTQRLYLDAAEKPSVYLMHSFYDMVMNDMRGRMARAFPTYYMLLIDEGRDLGVWRLQDNFYDISAITEFQVVKSRKIAADTAKIVMTNLFGTFTTEDDDMKDEYQYTMRDIFNSVFSPRTYVDKEYQRYSEARDINRAKLKPGARVNLRMGYSADASKLPIVFNGSVAEIQEGDLMTLVCQGDGIELANPAMFNATDSKDVADLKYNDSLISGFLGVFEDITTPRDILLNPLIAEGTWIHEMVKDWSKGRLFNANPFGIVHFGDKHYKEIFSKNGEVEQNIYEALSRPSWGRDVPMDSNDYSYSLTSAPKIKVGLQGNRSYWDLMHIAASVSPDYIAAVVPFQMRSSLFYGAARYYYAYDYDKLPNGQLVEKRKPFQQYHIYTSYTDILNNGISASDKEMRTCAVGIYQKPGVFTGSKSGSVGPLYLDIDIFPENQKMTTINCNFEYINFDLIPFTIPIVDSVMNEISETGGYQIAWRATANGLRESVKDMYSGELIVLGDPSVKPYDKIFINDIYEDMQGMVDVESVVHSFSTETGFTTSITPDCISSIDNKYEQVAHSTIKEMMLPMLSTHGILCASSLLFTNVVRGMFLSASGAIAQGEKFAQSATNSISKVLGKDNLAQFSGYTDKISKKLGYAFGVTPADLSMYRSLSNIENAYKTLGVTRKFEKSSDMVRMIDDMLKMEDSLKAIDPGDLSKILQESSSTDPKMVKARKDALELKSTFDKTSKTALKEIKFSKEEINKLVKSIDKNVVISKDLQKSIDLLNKSKGINYVDNMADITKELNALQDVVKVLPDLKDTDEVVTIFKRLDTKVFKNTTKSLKGFDSIGDTFKAVNLMKKGSAGIKALAASNILWLAAEIAITKSVQEYLERKMKNWQVLTVFPMMKNGIVFTAGLNGSKGSVFGSPTYNKVGWLEQQAIDFFEYKGGLSLVRDLFITTPEMLATINSFKRDNGFGKASGSSDVTRQAEILDLLSQVAKSNISGFNAYRKLYFDARVESSKSDAGLLAYRKYRLVDITEDEMKETKIISNNLVPISSDNNLISKLSDKGVFKFVGDQEVKMDTDTASYTSDKFILLNSTEGSDKVPKPVPCKRIEVANTDNPGTNTTVFVLPYLRADAKLALEMVVEEICKVIQPDYEDPECKFEYLKANNIVLHNGVMINSTNWMSTGYGFILEVKNYKKFSNIVEEIDKNDEEVKSTSGMSYKLLHIEKDKKLGNNTYDFWVSPRKV